MALALRSESVHVAARLFFRATSFELRQSLFLSRILNFNLQLQEFSVAAHTLWKLHIILPDRGVCRVARCSPASPRPLSSSLSFERSELCHAERWEAEGWSHRRNSQGDPSLVTKFNRLIFLLSFSCRTGSKFSVPRKDPWSIQLPSRCTHRQFP